MDSVIRSHENHHKGDDFENDAHIIMRRMNIIKVAEDKELDFNDF
jgi:hypothetical protein